MTSGCESEAGVHHGQRRDFHTILVILAVAFLARALLSYVSIGSNDAILWERFARQIDQIGILATYRADPWFNHPPVIAYVQWLAFSLADALGLRFSLLAKLPPIAMDVAIIYFAYRFLKPRLWLLWMLALNPASLLVSAYHGNTDSLCAGFCVLALLCLEQRRFAGASALLAAAFNVKLIPAVLLLPFLVRVHRLGGSRGLKRSLIVLALGALPFLPVLLLEGSAFNRNALTYNSIVSQWGLNLIALSLGAVAPDVGDALLRLTVANGREWVLVSAWVLGSFQALKAGPQSLTSGALAFSCFLVFAPGFGVQYVIYPVAALLLGSPRTGLPYACISGAFILLVYLGFWTGSYPLYSYFPGGVPFTLAAQRVGFIAWVLLLIHVVRTAWNQARWVMRSGSAHPH